MLAHIGSSLLYCATEEKSRGKVCNGQHDQSVHNSVQEAAHSVHMLAMREAPVCGRLEGALAPS